MMKLFSLSSLNQNLEIVDAVGRWDLGVLRDQLRPLLVGG